MEVVAQGPVAAVEGLRQWLHQGPKMARVESVLELALERDTPPPPNFEIL